MRHEKRDNINFYNGDNMEFMKNVPDKFYELAIIDPPYGININHNMGRRKGDKKSTYKKAIWDTETPSEMFFKEIFRVSENQIIWGGNYFLEFLKSTPCFIMWDKQFSEDLSFAQFEMAWTSFKSSSKKIELHPSNIKNRTHPTQKPIKPYRWLLQNYAKQGDKILDTHGGSMTHAIACDMEGYTLDIIEIDKDYFNDGLKAFDNYKRQLTLF